LTVHCISAGTHTSSPTSSTSRSCISTTRIAVIKSERCGVLDAKVSYCYSPSASELNKWITCISKNRILSGCFNSRCHDLCNYLTTLRPLRFHTQYSLR
jgi:hypothetical protein